MREARVCVFLPVLGLTTALPAQAASSASRMPCSNLSGTPVNPYLRMIVGTSIACVAISTAQIRSLIHALLYISTQSGVPSSAHHLVQRAALITGLTFALSAAVLAGVGGWAGESGNAPADKGPSPAIATGGEYAGIHVAAVAPLPASILADPGRVSYATSPAYTIRRVVPEVQLQFTVADEQGRLVLDLSADDFRILDNQAPVERFSSFARDENLPLRLGIVLDTSDSVKRVLSEEKAAALNFLERVMQMKDDRAFVMTFGADIRIGQTSTANRAQLIDAVERGKQPGAGTRLFDALYSACEEQGFQREELGPFIAP